MHFPKTFLLTLFLFCLLLVPAQGSLFSKKKKEGKKDKDKEARDDIALGMRGVAQATQVRGEGRAKRGQKGRGLRCCSSDGNIPHHYGTYDMRSFKTAIGRNHMTVCSYDAG